MDGAAQRRVFAAARQLFLHHGYATVSMQQIADAVGIKKASLYHHFPSKENLFTAVIVAEFEALRHRVIAETDIDRPFHQQLEHIVRAVMSSFQGEPGQLFRDYAAVIAPNPSAKHNLIGSPFELLRPTFERAMERGEIPRVPADEAIGLLLGMTLWQMDQCDAFPEAVMNVERAVRVIPLVLLGGLKSLEMTDSTRSG